MTRGATAKHSKAISFFDNSREKPNGKSIDVNRTFINSSSIMTRNNEEPMTSTYAMTISQNRAMQDVTRDTFGKTEQ